MGFKVVVIDDKPLIREAIIKTIDWRRLDCEIVGQAADGIEGKEIILAKKPDVIITDIKMPGLDGLELTEDIRPVLPNAKTIVITGYRDFDYARKSVKLGVFDFILKPIKNEELVDIVKRATNEIKNERKEEEERKRLTREKITLEQHYSSTLPLLKIKKAEDLIRSGAGTGPRELADLRQLGLHAVRHVTFLIRLKMNSYPEKSHPYLKIGSAMETLQGSHGLEVLPLTLGKDLAGIVLFDRVVSLREARLKVKGFCRDLQEKHLAELQEKYLITVSSLYKTLADLPVSYKEAVQMMDMNYFKSDNTVLFCDSSHRLRTFGNYSIFPELEEFYRSFEDPLADELESQLEGLVRRIVDCSGGNAFMAKSLLSEICITVSRYYYRINGNEGELNKSINEILSDIDGLEDIKQATEYMKQYVSEIRSKTTPREKEYSATVRGVLEYIHSSFSMDISLESVAEMFSVNPSYLSRLLKKETGENFVDILTRVRMRASKRLLKDPQKRVNEVAEMVGYKDYAYFYQVFRKVEGISPTEYKKTTASKKN